MTTTSLADSAAAVRACVFTLAGEPFAVDVARVRSVMIFDEWTAVPLAPPHVIGVANLHGDVVPIADARALLRLSPRHGGRRLQTLVVAAAGLEAALVIDGAVSLEAFPAVVSVDASSGRSHSRWALGFVPRDDRLVPLLDPAKLLHALREES